jgi:hypothetical protein
MAGRIALTVDLEPDWGRAGTVAFQRVLPQFLDLLDRRAARATFFVVADLVGVDPSLVAEIGRRHELGSHGCSHVRLDSMGPHEAARDIRTSRERLLALGVPVDGFRAPFFARRPGHWEAVREAGYAYDASLGSVVPGPHNLWLGRLACPHRRAGLWEFPTSAIAGGMVPLSLTWLRVCGCWPMALPGPRPKLMYLHLHEFLPAETARGLPAHLRPVLTHNCGRKAWGVLEHALDRLDGELVCCRDLSPRAEPGGGGADALDLERGNSP